MSVVAAYVFARSITAQQLHVGLTRLATHVRAQRSITVSNTHILILIQYARHSFHIPVATFCK